jgi:hypothetical protein
VLYLFTRTQLLEKKNANARNNHYEERKLEKKIKWKEFAGIKLIFPNDSLVW